MIVSSLRLPGRLRGVRAAPLRASERHNCNKTSSTRNFQKPSTAFTLLEMLLVLAILVAITMVTLPVVEKMYDTHRIRQAAMEVRTTLSAARLRAVDEGASFECRFEPDGRHLVIMVRGDGGVRFGSEESESTAASQRRTAGIHIELPESLYFWTANRARTRLEEKALRGLADGDVLGNRSWSPPVVFAANGSATHTQFEIRDQEGRVVELQVRGLTGAASASSRVKQSGA